MPAKGGYIYIISNLDRTVLYTGVTANLSIRIHQHKSGTGSEFTSKYRCKYLLYYSFFDSIEDAILKEKQLKRWRKKWKVELIKSINPYLKDLSEELAGM